MSTIGCIEMVQNHISIHFHILVAPHVIAKSSLVSIDSLSLDVIS